MRALADYNRAHARGEEPRDDNGEVAHRGVAVFASPAAAQSPVGAPAVDECQGQQ